MLAPALPALLSLLAIPSLPSAERASREADQLRVAGKCPEAIPLYERAVDDERAAPAPRAQEIRAALYGWAFCLRKAGETGPALQRFDELLAIPAPVDSFTVRGKLFAADCALSRGLAERALRDVEAALPLLGGDDDPGLALLGRRIHGLALRGLGRFDEAIAELEGAVLLADQTGQRAAQIEALAALARLHGEWAQAPAQEAALEKALALARAANDAPLVFAQLFSLGEARLAAGRPKQAAQAFGEAAAQAKARGDLTALVQARSSEGRALARTADAKLAMQALSEAQAAAAGNAELLSTARRAMTDALLALGFPEQAAQAALSLPELARASGDELRLEEALRTLGNAQVRAGQMASAVQTLQQAVALDDQRKSATALQRSLGELGGALLAGRRCEEAKAPLARSVQLLEELQRAARGEARHELALRGADAYARMAQASLCLGDGNGALRALEVGRVQLLSDRLGAGPAPALPTTAQLLALAQRGPIVVYAPPAGGSVGALAISAQGLSARAGDAGKALAAAARKHAALVPEQELAGVREPLALAVRVFRAALQGEGEPAADARRHLGRALFEALVRPIASLLKPGGELVVVPDPLLAFVPFEALVDEKGKLLVETITVRYAPSLSALAQATARGAAKGVGALEKKPLLALGGALYDEGTPGAAPAPSPEQIAALARGVQTALDVHGPVKPAYAALGLAGWPSLPGALLEAKAVAAVVPGAEVVTGPDVTETALKRRSSRGELARYRALHFATHAVAIPALPELSAVVLSQFSADESDDGFLRLAEIADLKLDASLVTLSSSGAAPGAGGEGVLGLAQALLSAGAGGAALTLWRTEAGGALCKALYARLAAGGTDAPAALAAVKRAASAGALGAAAQEPRAWSALVYYGRAGDRW